MKWLSTLVFVFSAIVMTAGVAHANPCGAVARQELADNPGAKILSVKSQSDNKGRVVCVIRIKLASKDGKPGRVITRKRRPD